MSTRVDESVEIARSPDEVARFMFDWRNDPVWIGGISSARLVGDGDFGVGARVARVASFLGRRIEYVLEVDEHVPGTRLAMHSVEGPFPMTVAYEVGEAPAGAQARVRVGGDATGFYRLARPLLDRQASRSIAADLRRLKGLLEAARDAS